ncbi:hypothetical protein PIB30_103164, partial [Stylosanthes scabra]|nr:hypothetical protein [Stylosanthes scabra]
MRGGSVIHAYAWENTLAASNFTRPRICVVESHQTTHMRDGDTPDLAYAYAWDSHPLATDQHPTHTTTQTTHTRGGVMPDHAYAYAWDSHPLATDQHPTHTTTQTNTLRTQLHRPTPYALLHM